MQMFTKSKLMRIAYIQKYSIFKLQGFSERRLKYLTASAKLRSFSRSKMVYYFQILQGLTAKSSPLYQVLETWSLCTGMVGPGRH